MSKKKENVLNFPKTTKDLEEQKEEKVNKNISQEEALKNAQKALQIAMERKNQGFRRLEEKCDNFDNRKAIDKDNPINENNIRDIEGAIRALTQMFEAYDVISNFMQQDLTTSSMLIQDQRVLLHIVMNILKAKGILTDDELKSSFEQLQSQLQRTKPKM
jgi:hypothetical protein